MDPKDIPRAFPSFTEQYHYGYGKDIPATVNPGMDLRDYFAGKALAGVMASRTGFAILDDKGPHILEATAVLMYQLADAMLKAREA